LVDWIDDESFWPVCPNFADIFIRCEVLEGFEPSGEVIGGDEVGAMSAQTVAIFIAEAFDGYVLEGSLPDRQPARP
jgi:hypothetical protein